MTQAIIKAHKLKQTVIPGLFFRDTEQQQHKVYTASGEMNSILLLFCREISITEGGETLKKTRSGDLSKLLEGLWVSLPHNWRKEYFFPLWCINIQAGEILCVSVGR